MQESLSSSQFSKSASAGDNFFEYVNSEWKQNNPIPGDEFRWSAFNEIQKQNEIKLHSILEQLASEPQALGSNKQKLSDFYQSFMDEKTLINLGLKPLGEYLTEISSIKNHIDLIKTVARLHRVGVNVFWSSFIASDDKQSEVNIFRLWQGGLGLPDRDYYFNSDERSEEIVSKYQSHISTQVTLAKLEVDPSKFAKTVYEIESFLAEESATKEDLRDYEKMYHKFEFQELSKLCPEIDWSTYYEVLGVGSGRELLVGQPKFIQQAGQALEKFSLDEIKSYLQWRLLSGTSGVLTPEIAEESFNFYEKVLNGTKEMKPRWRRAVKLVDASLGEALGQEFVAQYFNETAKSKMTELVHNLVVAFEHRIKLLSWMSEETKQKALIKLSKMTQQIGYPAVWKDYTALNIIPSDLCGNYLRANELEFERDLDKLDKPVDKMEWHMSPPTVNAYCSFWFNQIVFPAGILQPVFFDAEADDAINYGGIGVVIGHEITHGFDDQGRKYDENGSMNSWWNETDQKNFEALAQKVSDLYSSFEVQGGYKVNGELTLGENIADLGGLAIAYDALQISFQKDGRPELIDGLTPEQRFFASYARVWRNNITNEGLEKQIKTDPHSPAEWRVNGALMNVVEFYEAFSIKEDDKLFLPDEQRLELW